MPVLVITLDDFDESKHNRDELLNVKGIIVSTETGRIYPLGEAAAHLIGYMQNGEGKAGLEKLYDEQLSGTNATEETEQALELSWIS